jgi:cell division protein FtsB
MINKERLGEIKSRVWKDEATYVDGDNKSREGHTYTLSDYDYEWLIKQAERVEELEEENDELAERVHKLALDWSEVVDERNRYKHALEFYAHKKNYDIKHLNEDEHEIPVFKDYGEKARQALEGDDD